MGPTSKVKLSGVDLVLPTDEFMHWHGVAKLAERMSEAEPLEGIKGTTMYHLGFHHDTVEDGYLTSEQVKGFHGPMFAKVIDYLSKPEHLAYPLYINRLINWAAESRDTDQHVWAQAAIRVKIADHLHNLYYRGKVDDTRKVKFADKYFDSLNKLRWYDGRTA